MAFLDRLSLNFEEGVRIQAGLMERDIGIVAIRENIDTRDSTAAGKYFRRAMLALGAYQVDATSERIREGQARARGEGRRIGRPPALIPEQVEQCRRMKQDGAGLRHIARVMQCSPATVKKAISSEWTHPAQEFEQGGCPGCCTLLPGGCYAYVHHSCGASRQDVVQRDHP